MPRGTRRWGQHLTTCLAVMLVGAAVSQDWAVSEDSAVLAVLLFPFVPQMSDTS